MSTAVLLPLLVGPACAGYPEPLWDDDVEGETVEARRERRRRAHAICQRCPAAADCLLTHATLTGLTVSGIWAGQLDDTDRDRICAAPECQQPFRPHNSTHRYCTPQCKPRSRRGRPGATPQHRGPGRSRRSRSQPLRCGECEETFTPANSQQRYCNRVCGERHKSRIRTERARAARVAAGAAPPPTHCPCGQELTAQGQRRYCNRVCGERYKSQIRTAQDRAARAAAGLAPAPTHCPCGSELTERDRTHRARYCSKPCRLEAERARARARRARPTPPLALPTRREQQREAA